MSFSPPGGEPAPPGYPADPPGGRTRYPYRARRGRTVAGVAKGIADYFSIEPNWVRIGFVVTTFAGGAGLLLYLAAWLVLPEEGSREAGVLLFRSGRVRTVVGVVVLAVLASVLFGGRFGGFGAPFAFVVAGVVLWMWRADALRRREPDRWDSSGPAAPRGWSPTTGPAWAPPVPPPPPPPAPAGAAPAVPPLPAQPAGPISRESTAAAAPASGGVVRDDPAQPHSFLGALTFAASLLALAAALLVDGLGWVDVTPAASLGAALAVVAAGLLVGTLYGRARGVIVWGIFLSVATVAASAVGEIDVPFTAGVGSRTVRPATLAAVEPKYELTMGELTIDLGDVTVPPGQELPVEVNVGAGTVRVRLPADVGVDVTASTALGTVNVLGHGESGIDVDASTMEPGREGAGTVVLDVSAVTGEVTVERVRAMSIEPPLTSRPDRAPASTEVGR